MIWIKTLENLRSTEVLSIVIGAIALAMTTILSASMVPPGTWRHLTCHASPRILVRADTTISTTCTIFILLAEVPSNPIIVLARREPRTRQISDELLWQRLSIIDISLQLWGQLVRPACHDHRNDHRPNKKEPGAVPLVDLLILPLSQNGTEGRSFKNNYSSTKQSEHKAPKFVGYRQSFAIRCSPPMSSGRGLFGFSLLKS
jgi:hypothetical protein